MLNMKFLNREDVLNIFTDASILKYNDVETYIGSYGFHDPKNDITFCELDRYSTNNRSELKGVISALEYAIKVRDKYNYINLFIDSMLCVETINNWIYGWIRNSIDGVLYSASGEPVKNQDLIIYIIRLIADNRLNVNVFHIKGHVYNEGAIYSKALPLFSKTNKIQTDAVTIKFLCECNNIIDEATRALLSMDIKFTPYTTNPIDYKLYGMNFKEYSKLVNKEAIKNASIYY